MTAITRAATLVTIECANCSLLFAVPETWEQARRREHDTFVCPNGHRQHFPGESDVERERRLRERAEQRQRALGTALTAARDQAAAAERSASATRGHLTRLRRKIANGVCPVPGCRRSFQDVRRHIAGQHAEWQHEHPEVLA